MKFRPFFNILAFTLLTMSSVAYAGEANGSPFIGKGQAMMPPRGYLAMCERDASACGSQIAPPTVLAASSSGEWRYRGATGAIGCDRSSVEPGRAIAGSGVARFARPAVAGADLTRCPDTIEGGSTSFQHDRPNPEAPALAAANVDDHGLVNDVNRFVNGRVRQMTDRQIYGVEEYWNRSTLDKAARGDCEDIALEKRHELIARGFDPQRMFLAVVYRSRVGLHTVLVARMTDGDFVLDSRTPYVDKWTETAYSWVVVQDAANPNSWYRPERELKIAAAGTFPLNP